MAKKKAQAPNKGGRPSHYGERMATRGIRMTEAHWQMAEELAERWGLESARLGGPDRGAAVRRAIEEAYKRKR